MYTDELGSEMEATKRLCQKFDWYFSKRIYDATEKSSASFSRMSSYVSKMSLRCYQGKTYDDTIRDEETVINDVEDLKNNSSEIKIKQKTLAFFGGGFEPEELKFLQEQYDDWTSRHECSTKSQEEVFKNLCIAQLNILKAQQGKGSMKLVEALKVFQDLLGTANLKLSQNNEKAMVEQNTFGTLIKKWENERPISEPLPEWQDVDNIRILSLYATRSLCQPRLSRKTKPKTNQVIGRFRCFLKLESYCFSSKKRNRRTESSLETPMWRMIISSNGRMAQCMTRHIYRTNSETY